jgi:hypothetical protein
MSAQVVMTVLENFMVDDGGTAESLNATVL